MAFQEAHNAPAAAATLPLLQYRTSFNARAAKIKRWILAAAVEEHQTMRYVLAEVKLNRKAAACEVRTAGGASTPPTTPYDAHAGAPHCMFVHLHSCDELT
jgi:hypothetical protein